MRTSAGFKRWPWLVAAAAVVVAAATGLTGLSGLASGSTTRTTTTTIAVDSGTSARSPIRLVSVTSSGPVQTTNLLSFPAVNASADDYGLVVVREATGSDAKIHAIDSRGNPWTVLAMASAPAGDSRLVVLAAPFLTGLAGGRVNLSFGGGSVPVTAQLTIWSGVEGAQTPVTATSGQGTVPAGLRVDERGDVVVSAVSSASPSPHVAPGWTAISASTAYTAAALVQTYDPGWQVGAASGEAVTVALRPGAMNMLTNGSFEAYGAGGVASSWVTELTTKVSPTFEASTAGTTEGRYSQEIVWPGESTDTGKQKIELFQSTAVMEPYPVVGGSTYTFALDVSGRCHACYIVTGFEWFDKAGNWIGEKDSYLKPSSSPRTVSETATVPANAVRLAAYLQVPELYKQTSFHLYFDQADLYADATP